MGTVTDRPHPTATAAQRIAERLKGPVPVALADFGATMGLFAERAKLTNGQIAAALGIADASKSVISTYYGGRLPTAERLEGFLTAVRATPQEAGWMRNGWVGLNRDYAPARDAADFIATRMGDPAPVPSLKSFGHLLRAFAQRAGLQQREMEPPLGVTRSVLSYYYTGARLMPAERLGAFLDLVHADPAERSWMGEAQRTLATRPKPSLASEVQGDSLRGHLAR